MQARNLLCVLAETGSSEWARIERPFMKGRRVLQVKQKGLADARCPPPGGVVELSAGKLRYLAQVAAIHADRREVNIGEVRHGKAGPPYVGASNGCVTQVERRIGRVPRPLQEQA